MNNKIKRILPQLLTILFVVFVFGFFTINAQVNMDNRGIDFGFGFLSQEASFDMQVTLLDYDGQDSYLWAYVVALLNTLLVSFFRYNILYYFRCCNWCCQTIAKFFN